MRQKENMENDFIYTPSSTDISIRWRKLYNYVPASEQEFYKKKWADFKATFARTLDDPPKKLTPNETVVYQWRKRK
jgi:hypothetical protein